MIKFLEAGGQYYNLSFIKRFVVVQREKQSFAISFYMLWDGKDTMFTHSTGYRTRQEAENALDNLLGGH